MQTWILAFLVFAAIFLAVQFVYGYFFRDLRHRRKADERFASLREGRPAARQEVVKSRAAAAAAAGHDATRLDLLIVQSGIRLSRSGLGLVFAALSVVFALATPMLPWIAKIPVGACVAALVVWGVLARMRSRRVAAFAEQLPDVLDIIVRSLRAGHPLPVSLSLVAREMAAPAGEEFAITSDEITYGRDLREALDNLYWRVGYIDLQFLVTSVSVSYQTGGNLGEILGRLSRMLRDRFRMRRKVRALSSEGRFSALALSIFPFIMFGIINLIAPTYYGAVWGSPLVNIAGVCGAILLMIGNFVMYRMVNFKI